MADVCAGLVGTLLLLLQVTLIARLLAGIVDGSEPHVPLEIVALLVLVIVLRAGLVELTEWSGRRAASAAMSGLRHELVALFLGSDRPPGADTSDLATSAVQGIDGLEGYFAKYLPQVVLSVTVPVAVIVWTAMVDLMSAAIMVVTLPVIPIFMVLIGRSAATRSRAHWQAMVTLSSHFLDVVEGLPTLRAFNRGRAQIPKIAASTEQYRRTTMSTLRLAFLSGVVLDLATTLSMALVAVTLGVRLVSGGVALGPALTVLLLVPELYAPIRQVGSLFHASADGLAGSERILELLESSTSEPLGPKTAASPPARPLPDARDHILLLDDVTVTFPGRPLPALSGVDLAVEPGELVVVTGSSGSGKTTLGRLLVGLLRPDTGDLLIGDHRLVPEDLDDWRRQVAWASQHPAIVHDTVAGNISLGSRSPDEQAVISAARRAGAHEFIGDLPDGYATVLGKGGHGLSAGQRQRVGLARALMTNAPVLVLDEPTAHLDPIAARHVYDTLDEIRSAHTIVLITHDQMLMPLGDREVHVEDGRVTVFERST